jgi:hypothetical protein
MPSSTDNRWSLLVGFPRATVAMELIREELAAPEGGE